ncbi:peptide/nickel transport system permease protein [Pseudoduganella lurida]|uniref:Peptide/nickel transport system permease protein n=1 Tax=Pseudoduganella lurida TaxID=1036180 RepID=A0A562RAR9_9BURK|nr:ABC transporter permease [Pseudoduganella lurida]TWI65490.1 peptide/nickel transport system permease protein [Pseudoduganella lurida]
MRAPVTNGSAGLWTLAWKRLRADRLAMAALAVVAAFLLLLVLSASGLVAADWEDEVGVNYAPPTFAGVPNPGTVAAATTAPPARANPFDPLAADLAALRAQLPDGGAPPVRRATLPFGADKWGHDIVQKTIKGGETSIVVGLVAAFVAVGLGTLFGAISGYYGGLVDDAFNWLYNVFTSIPSILMILTVAAVLQQKGVLTIVLILGLTGWTGPYRLIRAEYIKHKAREYVLAADAIGASAWRKMFAHIFPNVSHVALVQMSILVVGFIKAEVILSFLGFGVPAGVVSWGSMLNEAQNELLLGKWWQLTAAATAMAVLVTAFSLLADALRDALDPKVKTR